MLRSQGPKRTTMVKVPGVMDVSKLRGAVEQLKFRECKATDEESWGFCTPDDDARWPLISSHNQIHLINLRRDRRIIPSRALHREWHALIKKEEEASEPKRKLTKPERDALKDRAKISLFKISQPREHITQAVYFEKHAHIAILESSPEKVDFFIAKLNRALEPQNMAITWDKVNPGLDLSDTLTAWVNRPEELPKQYGFEIGTNLRLNNHGNRATLVNQEVETAEVRELLQANKEVEQIALTWNETVSFAITAKRAISKINFQKFCADNIKDVKDTEKENIQAYEQGTFMVYMDALWELWTAIDNIPESLV